MICYIRFKISGEWLDWYRIDGEYETEEAARRIFMKNTRFSNDEIEVTAIEPEKYFGRK